MAARARRVKVPTRPVLRGRLEVEGERVRRQEEELFTKWGGADFLASDLPARAVKAVKEVKVTTLPCPFSLRW